jgi:hypothetical protein
VEPATDLRAFKNTGASIGLHKSPDTKAGLGLEVERRKDDVVRLGKAMVTGPQAVRFLGNQALLNQSVALNEVLRGKKPDLKQVAVGAARVVGVTASALAQAAAEGTGLRVIQGLTPLNGGYVVDKGRFGALGSAISSLNPFASGDKRIAKGSIALRGNTINDGFIGTEFKDAVGFDKENQTTTISLIGSNGKDQKSSNIVLNSVNIPTGQNLFSKEISASSVGRYLQGAFDSRSYEKRQFGQPIQISDSSKISDFFIDAGIASSRSVEVPSLTREGVPLISLFGVQDSQTPNFAPFNTISKIEKDVKNTIYLGADKQAKKAIKDLTTPGKFILPNPDSGTVRISDESVNSTITLKSRIDPLQRKATKSRAFSEIPNLDTLTGYVGERAQARRTTRTDKPGKYSYYEALGEGNVTEFSGILELPEVNKRRTLELSFQLDGYLPNTTVKRVADAVSKDQYLDPLTRTALNEDKGPGKFITALVSDQSVSTKFDSASDAILDSQKQATKNLPFSQLDTPVRVVSGDTAPSPITTGGRTEKRLNRKRINVGSAGSLDSRFYVREDNKEKDNINVLSIRTEKLGDTNQDIIPFEIINHPAKGNPEYLYFRAYLDSLGDSYNGEWNGTRYIGRAEELYNYTGFKRSLNFGFKVAAHSAQELKPLYEKLNRLAGTTAPTYQNGLFLQGVFSKITIGDYIQKLPGFFTSVAFAWQTAYPWEIGNTETGAQIDSIPRVPHILDVTVNFQPVHDFTPQYDKAFFGFPSNSALPISNV